MNNHVQSMLCVLAVLVAVCTTSCDKQAIKSETAASSEKMNSTKATSPANLKHVDGGTRSLDVKATLKQIANTSIVWDNGSGAAAKRQLADLIELHKTVSETPGYENVLVSADCELKLCNSIVPALISGHLSSTEAQSLLASIAANRFSRGSLASMLNDNAPDSKQARVLIADLQNEKPVNLVEASDDLLREQGASFLEVPAPDNLGDLLDKPNPARAFQYHLMGAAKLDVASVIVEYASMGGDLKADDPILATSLQKKVPHLINAPGKLTNRTMDVHLIVDFLRDWRNGSYAR